MMGSRLWSRLKDVVAPVLLVVLPLCLFGPYTIFSGNEAEFSAPFWVLVRPLLLAGIGVALALIAAGIVLPDKLFRAYVVLLFSVGLVIWIQGNLLVADYGAFTGVPIDWTIESWRNPYEIALWIAVPVLSVTAAKYVVRIAPFASGVLIALQWAALLMSVVQHADSAPPVRWQGPTDSMFELSRTRNVIHIVLDAFQSDVFGEILAEERPKLDRSLSGAVFFANHTGAFPTTIASMPAMLTGKVYRNDRPLQRYMRDILKETSIFKSLRASGYRADAASGMYHGSESATNYVRLQRPYVSYNEYIQFTAWQLADLSLFRHAPHILRPAIHNDESWRLQAVFGPGDTRTRQHHSVNGAVVLDEFARRLRPATDEPVSKYLHVGIPHRPVVVDGNCNFTGVKRATRAAFKEQARCAVNRVAQILDRLKEIGVYDNTFVVISSDHGIGSPPPQFVNNRQTPMGEVARIAGNAMALLVVKPLNSNGPVRISRAPTTITDIPATILDGVGVAPNLPGEPALKLAEDAQRVRPWAFYDWERDDWGQNYFPTLDIIEINGPVLDGKNWTLLDTIYEPGAGEALRTRGLYEVHRSRSGLEYRWSMPHIFLHVPAGARSFEMKVRSVAPKPQTVTVSGGDQVLGTVTLADQSWVTIKHTLPPPQNPAAYWVHVHADPSWRAPGAPRVLGVQTRDIIFAP
jgi:arylsulfatase A-like enzyme